MIPINPDANQPEPSRDIVRDSRAFAQTYKHEEFPKPTPRRSGVITVADAMLEVLRDIHLARSGNASR